MSDPKDIAPPPARKQTHVDLATLGLAEVAYLKKAVVDGVPGFAIHAANGQTIGFAPGEESAIAAVMTNDMDVASVH